MRFLWVVLFTVGTLSAEIIPRDVLFSNPDKVSCSISPDGKYIAYLAPYKGVMNVWVRSIGKKDDRPLTKVVDRPIFSYFWTYKENILIFGKDNAGDENTQLFIVDIEKDKITPLTKKGKKSGVLKGSPKKPNELLLLSNARDAGAFDVFKINLETFENSLVFENKQGFIGFDADEDLTLRILTKMDEQGGVDLYFKEKDRFILTWHYDFEDSDAISIVSITPDNKTLYFLDAKGRDKSSLKAYDFPSKKVREIFSSEKSDVQGVIVNNLTKSPEGCIVNYLKPTIELLDSSLKKDFQKIKTFQNEMEIGYISRDLKDKTWVICFYKDDGPSEYWLYDRVNRKETFLFTSNQRLEKYPLVKMNPVVIQSRDGLNLVSYLSRPKDQTKPGPLILYVHGGPWHRDTWGYNPYHQWLVNRGYSVLSVNFRGSTGFGKDFVNAGNLQWSKKMHDDLIDAVDWAINEKIADPKKIAIMGGSYGGYATLVGLTFTPDVFALGVDIVGVSHIKTFIESFPPYWKPMLSNFEKRVGSLQNPEFLDEISPLTKIANINKPLLILQGKNDPRVKEMESEQIVQAMVKKKLDVTYVLFPDEGHGFRVPENNIASNAVIEKFLSKHLGGEFEKIDDALKNSSAQIVVGKEQIN